MGYNFDFLAIYASALPVNWYSAGFLHVLRSCLDRITDGVTITLPGSILELIQAHSELESKSSAQSIGICSSLVKASMSDKFDKSSKSIILNALINYAGKSSAVIEGTSFVLENSEYQMNTTLTRSLAKLLSSIPDLDYLKASQALLYPLSGSLSTSFDFISIMKVFYFVGQSKCKSYADKYPPAFCSISSRSLPAFTDFFLPSVSNGEAPTSEASIFALLGLTRSLQDRIILKEKASRKLVKDLEAEVLSRIRHCAPINQTFLFGEITSNSPNSLKALGVDVEEMIDICLDCIFLDPRLLANDDAVYKGLSQIGAETNGELDNQIIAMLDAKFSKTALFFPLLSRMCLALQKGMRLSIENSKLKVVQKRLSKVELFCAHLSKSCDGYFFVTMDPKMKGIPKSRTTLISLVLKYLKSALFSCLLLTDSLSGFLLKALKEDLQQSTEERQMFINLIHSCLKTFTYLNFVTAKFGLDALQLFEEQLILMAGYLVKVSVADFQFSSCHLDIIEWISRNRSETPVGLQFYSKLHFEVLLSKKLVDCLPDTYIDTHMIPSLRDYLVFKSVEKPSPIESILIDIQDLSHSIWLKLFESSAIHQRAIRSHYRSFAKTIIEVLLPCLPRISIME